MELAAATLQSSSSSLIAGRSFVVTTVLYQTTVKPPLLLFWYMVHVDSSIAVSRNTSLTTSDSRKPIGTQRFNGEQARVHLPLFALILRPFRNCFDFETVLKLKDDIYASREEGSDVPGSC